MSTEIPPPGRPLVSRPGGVITRRQALATGLPATTVESWVQRGRWTRLARGIYATSGGPPSREALLWAALLRAGPGAVLSHQTAAERAEIGAALSILGAEGSGRRRGGPTARGGGTGDGVPTGSGHESGPCTEPADARQRRATAAPSWRAR